MQEHCLVEYKCHICITKSVLDCHIFHSKIAMWSAWSMMSWTMTSSPARTMISDALKINWLYKWPDSRSPIVESQIELRFIRKANFGPMLIRCPHSYSVTSSTSLHPVLSWYQWFSLCNLTLEAPGMQATSGNLCDTYCFDTHVIRPNKTKFMSGKCILIIIVILIEVVDT